MAIGDRIPMKSGHIHVEGNDTLVNGTPLMQRDLAREVNWWKLRPVKEIALRPVDENGVPYELCSAGHYRPVRGFDKDTSRKTGLRAFCKQCRHEQYLRQSAEAAEQAGKALGRYREKKVVRGNLARTG